MSDENFPSNHIDKVEESESYIAGIPVLLKNNTQNKTYEGTLLRISSKEYVVRLETRQIIQVVANDALELMIDPELFDLNDHEGIKFLSQCIWVDKTSLQVGGQFEIESPKEKEFLLKIINYFKNLDDYEY